MFNVLQHVFETSLSVYQVVWQQLVIKELHHKLCIQVVAWVEILVCLHQLPPYLVPNLHAQTVVF